MLCQPEALTNEWTGGCIPSEPQPPEIEESTTQRTVVIDQVVAAHPGDDLTILLGYGLCSQALVGVEARGILPVRCTRRERSCLAGVSPFAFWRALPVLDD